MGDDSHSAFEMGVGIEVEMIRQLTFKGAVEGIGMRKVKINSSICMYVFTAKWKESVSWALLAHSQFSTLRPSNN